MGVLPPIPTDLSTLRTPDGTRFWEIPVSFKVIYACAGDGELLAAWLVTAAAEREDAGLGLPPRALHILAATAGQPLDDFALNCAALVRQGLLTRAPDGRVRVPWGRLYEQSVESANHLLLAVKTLRTAAAASPAAVPLSGDRDLLAL
jgi:hypothetical protein